MSESDLGKCVPCHAGTPPLDVEEVRVRLTRLPTWTLVSDGKRIRREWTMKFPAALELFRRVGEVAEAEGHHPDLHLVNYHDVAVELWTHAIGGLSENDFILAAKIDAVV